MKYLKYYNQLKEAMTQEEIMKAHRNEKAFVKHMEVIAKSILKPEEEDVDHPVNEQLMALIYRVYDNYFYDKANSATGLTEKDYQDALELLKPELDKYRMSKGCQKLVAAYLKRLAKMEPKPIQGFKEDDPMLEQPDDMGEE